MAPPVTPDVERSLTSACTSQGAARRSAHNWHDRPSPGRFLETCRALRVMRGR